MPSAKELEQKLLSTSFPRLQMMLILAVSALSAFGTSVSLLAWGVHSLGLRYGLSTLSGYLCFLLVIRVWIRFQLRHLLPEEPASPPGLRELDLPDPRAIDALGSAIPEASEVFSGGGGAFGGGGADAALAQGASEGSSGVVDALSGADEGLPIVIAVLAVLGGVLALGFVVYSSPILFAEVLLDVMVVGALYKKSRQKVRSHWTRGVIRRTYLPALVLTALVTLFGFVMQSQAPEADTLGEVLERMSEDVQSPKP